MVTIRSVSSARSTNETRQPTSAGAGSRSRTQAFTAGSASASGVSANGGGPANPVTGRWTAVRSVSAMPLRGVRVTSGSGGELPLANASSVPAERSKLPITAW